MALIDKAITRTLQKEYRRQTFRRTQAAKRNVRAAITTGSGGSVSAAGQIFPAGGVSTVPRVPLTVRNAGRLSDARFVPDTGAVAISSISFGGGGVGGGVSLSAGNGIQIVGSTISVKLLPGMSALVATGSGLAIGNAIAGAGLTINGTTKVMAVGAGDGIQVNANDVQVDETVVRITRKVDSGSGLVGGGTLAADRTISVGSGFGMTITADAVAVNQAMVPTWTGIHTFNARPEINNNLHFKGGNRDITATNTLTLAPATDLYLDPGGLVVVPMAQTVRTPLFTDAITGILGFASFEQGGNVRQLTIGAIKADEIYVRYFTADEVRVTRGEQIWARSYGIVETTFTLPAIGSTVDVWFEEAPDIASAKLFLHDNWLLARTINLDGPNLAMRVYFKVVDVGATGYIMREDAAGDKLSRQQWRIRRMFGGFDGTDVNKGVTIVDIGQPQVGLPGEPGYISGQGIVALSALRSSGGPYVETSVFKEVISSVPQFAPKTRMGNLKNTVDYTIDTYGFVTGNNMGLLPSAGFSGMVSDEENGMRLFNTDLEIYDGGIKIIHLSPERGLDIREDDAVAAVSNRNISWVADVDNPTAGARSSISAARSDIGAPWVAIETFTTQNMESGVEARAHFRALDPELSTGGGISIRTRQTLSTGAIGARTTISGNEVDIGSKVGIGSPDLYPNWATLVVSDNNSLTDADAGLVIAQFGSGDSVLHWYGEPGGIGGTYWYSAGVDNSDGDKWKLSASSHLGTSDIIIFNPSTGAVTINGFDPGGSLPAVDIMAGDGITVVGPTVSVDATVLRTARNLIAGDGLTGGGDLSADRTFNVDGTVVRVGRLLTAGAGLTGGGSLSADRTFNVGAGDGITVNADSIQVNATVVRTTRSVLAGNGLTGGGDLSADRTLHVGAGDGIAVVGSTVAVNSTVVRTTRTITGAGAIGGGGDLSANRVITLTLATPSGLNQTTGLALDDSIAGLGLSMASKVLNVNLGTGLQFVGDTIAIAADVVTSARSIIAGAGLVGGGTLAADRTLDVNPGDGIQIVADAVAVDATVVRTGRLVSTSGALAGGGDLSADRTIELTLATPSGLNQTAGLALDNSVAGDGIDITAKVLSILVGDGLALLAGEAVVDLAHSFIWTGTHTYQNMIDVNAGATFNAGVVLFNTPPQLATNLDFIDGARTITGTGNITLLPAGDLVLSPAGQNVLPAGSYLIDLGDYNRKYRTLYVAELYTENLVAQDVMATIGGRVVVSPSTSLIADMTAVQTTIDVKHNNLTSGMYIRLENAPAGVPQFEVMQVTSGATVITDGFRYTVTRNLDGTGANVWLAGDGVVSLRTSVGEGWIDLASTATVLGDIGPTMAIYSRHATANWNDVAAVVAMGNLESYVDYGSAEFGFAVGNDLTLDASNGFSGLTADRTSGIRMFNVDINMYNGADKVGLWDDTRGIAFALNASVQAFNSITWKNSIDSIISEPDFQIAAWRPVPSDIFATLQVNNTAGAGAPGPGRASISMQAAGIDGTSTVHLDDGYLIIQYDADPVGPGTFAYIMINDLAPNHTLIGQIGNIGYTVASTLEVFTDHNANDATSGLTITGGQTTTSDALLHWRVLSGLIPTVVEQAWVMGIDRSDSNALVIATDSALGGLNRLRIGTDGVSTFSGNVTSLGSISVSGAAGIFRSFSLMTDGSLRWLLDVDNTAESGGNAGGNLTIRSRTDAGGVLRTNLTIDRATGAWAINGVLNVAPATSISTIGTGSVDARMDFVANRSTSTNTAFRFADAAGNPSLDIQDDGDILVGTVVADGKVTVRRASAGTILSIGPYSITEGVNVFGTGFFRGSSDDAVVLTIVRAAANNALMGAGVNGDTFRRWLALADGELQWGPGNATRDTNLYRPAANTLKTDDAFVAASLNLGNETLSTFRDEATWTPVMTSSGTNPTVGYSGRYGRYNRENKFIKFQLGFTISSISGGSGSVRISLPATSFSVGVQIVHGMVEQSGISYAVMGVIQASTAYFTINFDTVGPVAPSSFSATDDIYFSGGYYVA